MNQLSDCFYDKPDDVWREVRDGHFEAVPEDSRPTSGLSRAVALLLIGCFATPIVLPLFPSSEAPGAPTEVVLAEQVNLTQICAAIADQVQALRQLQSESKDGNARPARFQERCDEIDSALDQSLNRLGQWQFPSDQQRQARELMLVVSLAGEARGQLVQAVEATNSEDRSVKNGYAKIWLTSASSQLDQTRRSFPDS